MMGPDSWLTLFPKENIHTYMYTHTYIRTYVLGLVLLVRTVHVRTYIRSHEIQYNTILIPSLPPASPHVVYVVTCTYIISTHTYTYTYTFVCTNVPLPPE